jgi:phosphate transport system protein
MTSSHHTVRSYDSELEEVTRDILAMGGLVEAQLRSSLDALIERDHELAARVIETDHQIDDLERQVDELGTRILALRQPMAEDLRRVKTALKVASNLERMGDLASNIAKRSLTMAADASIPQREGLKRMGAAVYAMTNDVLNAYRDENKDLALSVWYQDEAIDEMYASVFRAILADMIADPNTIANGTQVHFVAKNIERMGDHTTNIAEMVAYMIEGELPGDERPKGNAVPQAPSDGH